MDLAKFLFTLGRLRNPAGERWCQRHHTRKRHCGKGGTESDEKAKPETRANPGPEARKLPADGPGLRTKRPETAMEDIPQGLAPSAPVRPGAGMNAGVFPQAHCRSQCWFAQGNTCRCACGGENHGAVRPNGKRSDTNSPNRKSPNGKRPETNSLSGKNPNGKSPTSASRRDGREFQALLWSADPDPQEDSSPATQATAEPQRRTAWPPF